MDETRRSFLKKVGFAAVGAGCSLPLLGTAGRSIPEDVADAPPGTKQWGMVIDIKKCLNQKVSRACAEACHREHNVPRIPGAEDEVKWLWTERFENAFSDQTHRFTADYLKDQPVLVLCNHCTSPPCVKVCPTQATWRRRQDGVVMMDMHRCIGCRYCIAACPYGARSFYWRDPRPYLEGKIRPEFPTRTKGVVEKCNFCVARLRDGLEPACVEAARAVPEGQGALTFGDLRDPGSQVRQLLRDNHTICRKQSLGTGPNVFYMV